MITSDYHNLEEVKERGSAAFPVSTYIGQYVCAGSVLHYHWHKEWQWIYMIEGDAMITLDGRRIRLNENESIFINSGQLHSGITENPNGCVHLSVVFDPEKVYDAPWRIKNACESFISGKYAPHSHYSNRTPGERMINQCMRQIYELSQNETLGSEISMLAYLHAAMGHIISNDLYTNMLNLPKARESEQIKQVLHYIHSNYGEKITLNDLAQLSGMSVQSLCRTFKREMGTTIVEYLNTYRIYEATLLLRRSSLSINTISAMCGFETTSYFIKIFKKIHGVTPMIYREEKK